MNIENVIIFGSGPAGLTAALYTARANLQPLVIHGTLPGGQLTKTAYVENWPGNVRILGPELMLNMQTQAQLVGAQFMTGSVDRVDLSTQPFTVHTSKQKTVQTHTIIIATGTVPKTLNCPGEKEYWGKGVSTCAVCDGALYTDKPVIVVGGGDSAIEHALFLTQFTNRVTLVHRTAQLTASSAMQERLRNKPMINVIANHDITAVTGNGTHVTSIEIMDQRSKQTTQLPTHALFLAIGSRPNTDFVADQLNRLPSGHIIVQHPSSRTSVPGVYAAGDVIDAHYRQAITAAGMGCIAAMDVIEFLRRL